MGCGPSKDANVATSNTVSTKKLPKNSSEEPSNTAALLTQEAATDVANVQEKEAVAEVANVQEKEAAADVAKVHEKEEAVVEKAEGDVAKNVELDVKKENEDEEDGKFVAASSSPDRYFSSRKDEVTVEAIVGSAPAPAVEEEAVKAEGEVEEKKGEDVASSENEEGKETLKEPSDLKETILEEENGKEENVEEEKSATLSS